MLSHSFLVSFLLYFFGVFYASAEIQGNYVEIPHGVIPIRSRDYYELVNPFIMKIKAKYSDEGY